ncbi:ClbS/DfsB family four-helix bundle protein [Paraglaciecola arctica]|uniref:ClbS/DfsB family four-helix bundle protein n=1 Tax=Paraglaciecola arctica BSs20135 TaxID=493475 RepID=K6XBE4_9ALTE|nr:ClbS/DfsB family four-helix bundle protein [Paraglaciecola arctica]GAC17939.1 hypothetical protein GARC_0958 [Paraglaciecola arctica BSs20135]
MTSIALNKLQLITAIQRSFSKLEEDYLSIPAEYSRICEIEGNVKNTSICDTLAYLIGWGELVLKWYEEKSKNRYVDFPETGFKWNQLGQLAQHFQYQHREINFTDLLSMWIKVTSNILTLIGKLDDQELYGKPWYDKWTLGRMIQFNTSSPMKNVRAKVRRFKRSHNLK